MGVRKPHQVRGDLDKSPELERMLRDQLRKAMSRAW